MKCAESAGNAKNEALTGKNNEKSFLSLPEGCFFFALHQHVFQKTNVERLKESEL